MTALTTQQSLLYRAVEISLFSWSRAELDDKLDDEQRMGWWGILSLRWQATRSDRGCGFCAAGRSRRNCCARLRGSCAQRCSG